MHRVSIQFKSEQDMKTFYSLCEVDKVEMNIRALTILCYCDEREIELAINGFDAKVIRREPVIHE